MIKNVMFGADPEVFMSDRLTAHLVSAVGKIGGTKKEPKPIDDKGHYIQEDNVAIEFNIPPVKTPEEFQNEITFMMNYIHDLIKDKYRLAIDAARIFPEAELRTPAAQTFGCEPDYNAWSMTENSPPNLVGTEFQNLRTCGGHLHVSWDQPEIADQVNLVRALDVFAGLPFAAVEPQTDRARLYGGAGAFRFKKYGIEYRTLSNFWLRYPRFSNSLIQQANQAIRFINDGKLVDEADGPEIQRIIKECAYVDAQKLIRKYKVDNTVTW